MKAFARHFVAKAKGLVFDPLFLFFVFLAGAFTWIAWHKVSAELFSNVRPIEPIILIMASSGILGASIEGRSTSAGRVQFSGFRAHPALPIGISTRIFSDSLLALALIVAVRLMALPFFGHETFPLFLKNTLVGSIVLLPMLPSSVIEGSNKSQVLVKRLIVFAVIILALKAGLFQSLSLVAGTSLALFLFSLALSSWNIPFFQFHYSQNRSDTIGCYRKARPPESQLRHDQFLGPLFSQRFLWTVFIVIEGMCLVLYLLDMVPIEPLLNVAVFLSIVVFIIVFFSPMGMYIQAGTPSHSGPQSFAMDGSFITAWSVLPVRKEAIVRGVFFHGIIVGTIGLAISIVFLVAFSSINYVWPLLLLFSLVPIMAGMMTNAVVGDKPWCVASMISIGLLLPMLGGYFSFPKYSSVIYSIVIVLTLLGTVPALRHLRSRSNTGEHERMSAMPAQN